MNDTIVGNLVSNNHTGIFVDGTNGGFDATIGGSAAAGDNTIGSNVSAGVSIGGTGRASSGNLVLGNYIGTDSSGAVLNNAIGVSDSSTSSAKDVEQHDRRQHNRF